MIFLNLYHKYFFALHSIILFYFLFLKYNWFTEFCCFLLNLKMNQQSVQFSCSVVSDSLPPHESQHARPPCPSPTPGVHPDSRPLRQWCHPAISSSVVPFSSCPQFLPASESFPMSQLFTSGGHTDRPEVVSHCSFFKLIYFLI